MCNDKNIKRFDYLDENILENLYRYSYAMLFPSLSEGFGYPPLEAMKYSRPVLASGGSCIPEILGDAPIYFNPLLISDIENAMLKIQNNNEFENSCKKSLLRYKLINEKQKKI